MFCYYSLGMSQINFRISSQIEKFITLKAQIEQKTKTAISKEIFLKGMNDVMFPYLTNLYKEGKVSIKKIAEITNLH